jgi:putative SOS response-associated peptidase YedK
MCGRYTLTAPGEAMRELARGEEDADSRGLAKLADALAPRFNIAPAQPIPILRRHARNVGGALAIWGLIPRWAKDSAVGARLINARSETVREKPAFRDSFATRRCLVPADGFYEWVAAGGGQAGGRAASRRQPYLIRRRDRRPFAFAGLWDRWVDPASGEIVDSATILTCPPNPLVAPIHDRMPVIFFGPEERRAWTSDTAKPEGLLELLRPADSSSMEALAVRPLVNRVDNDSLECVEPATVSDQPSNPRQAELFR